MTLVDRPSRFSRLRPFLGGERNGPWPRTSTRSLYRRPTHRLDYHVLDLGQVSATEQHTTRILMFDER